MGMRSTLFDTIVVYEMFRRLTESWTNTPAYKHGIIDANGNVLRSYTTLKTPEERLSYTILDRMVFSLRRMIVKLPGGSSHLASAIAALWLIREPKPLKESTLHQLLETTEWTMLAEDFLWDCGVLVESTPNMEEDAPANASGGGGVAGMGQPPGTHFGEPAVGKRKREQFAGAELFEVDSDCYANCLRGKKRFLKYTGYTGSDTVGEDIRTYARSNPGAPILLKDRTTGAMSYLRYGKNNPALGLSIHGY